MADTLEKRLQDLERRVSELEGSIGFIIPTMRQIHLDLLGFKDETERRFDAADGRFDALEGKVDGIGARVEVLPRVIAETVKESERRLLQAINAKE